MTVDGNTAVELPGAVKMDPALPFAQPGKPHNWSCPNIVAGDNDTLMYARWHEELAAGFAAAIGDTGRGWLRSEQGPETRATLMQIDGGRDAFPGPGRATVQLVHWAFGPRVDALVIQASDVAGLTTAAEALANLPGDHLSDGVEQAREALWREFHIGGRPPRPGAKNVTAAGLTTRHAPQRFVINFTGPKPPREDEVVRPQRDPHRAYSVPGVIEPEQYVPFVRRTDPTRAAAATDATQGKATAIDAAHEFYESSTARVLLRDLRFTDALLIVVDAKQPGKMQIAADGQFRYSDSRPRSQPQWEDVLAVYNAVVRRSREPMSIEVRRGGKTIGQFKPTQTETRHVPLSTRPSHGSGKEKEATVREKVVIQLEGEVELAAGRNELLLIHHNIVDGVLDRLRFGVGASEADAAKPTSYK